MLSPWAPLAVHSGRLSGGEGAGQHVVERIQERVQAARSILQFVTRGGAGDREARAGRRV